MHEQVSDPALISKSIRVPEHIRDLIPYIPGKPIEETQRELKIKRVIKLASNENPLGPSPKALKAVRTALVDLHRYPDSAGYKLKQALAKKLGRDPKEIALGNGSDDLIHVLARSYCKPGDAMVTSEAAFSAYKIAGQILGLQKFETPMTSDLRFDLQAMAKEIKNHSNVTIVFIANPNNPTGTYVSTAELREFLMKVRKIRDGSVIVAIDSAYTEYVTAKDLEDSIDLQAEFANVVVFRTFSKAYGLAGLRIGYAIASREIIATMDKVRQPFNVNSLGLVGAEAALSDQAFVKRAKKLNIEGMKFWEKGLKELGIPFWKSQGNFLLVDVAKGLGRLGGEVYFDCLKLGVIFRPVANYGLHHALRISVGTMEENKIGLKALQTLKRRLSS
jgi:histidinol-phosphate aminotransferase